MMNDWSVLPSFWSDINLSTASSPRSFNNHRHNNAATHSSTRNALNSAMHTPNTVNTSPSGLPHNTNPSHSNPRLHHNTHTPPQPLPLALTNLHRRPNRSIPLQRPRLLLVGPPRLLAPAAPHEPFAARLHRVLPLQLAPHPLAEAEIPRHRVRRGNLRRVRCAPTRHIERNSYRPHTGRVEDR